MGAVWHCGGEQRKALSRLGGSGSRLAEPELCEEVQGHRRGEELGRSTGALSAKLGTRKEPL